MDKVLFEQFDALKMHLFNALFLGAIPTFLISGIFGFALIYMFASQAGRIDRAAIYAFAFVGAAAGLMIGASREPIAHVALPAILTLVSSFLAYLYTTGKPDPAQEKSIQATVQSLAGNKSISDDVKGDIGDLLAKVRFIPVCIIALAVTSITASFYGGSVRAIAEKNDRQYAEWLLEYEKIQIPLNKEILRRKAGFGKPQAEEPKEK